MFDRHYDLNQTKTDLLREKVVMCLQFSILALTLDLLL